MAATGAGGAPDGSVIVRDGLAAVQQMLYTSRLQLRPCAATDIEQLHRHWTEPMVRQYLWDGRIISTDTVREFVAASLDSAQARGYGLWLLLGQPDGLFRGVCGLRDGTLEWPELVYSIATPYWGVGFATESARGVLQHAFAGLGLRRVVATVDTPNLASIRVLEKLGMSMTGERLVNGNPIRYYWLARAAFKYIETS